MRQFSVQKVEVMVAQYSGQVCIVQWMAAYYVGTHMTSLRASCFQKACIVVCKTAGIGTAFLVSASFAHYRFICVFNLILLALSSHNCTIY